MPYKYPSLRTTLPVAGYYARLDAGAAATDQFTADGSQDGTLTNGATRTDDGGLAYSFDGVDDYITFGTSTVLNFERTNAFTVSCWLKITTLSNAAIVSRRGGSSSGVGWEVVLPSADTSKVQLNLIGASTSLVVRSTASIVANTWVHLVVTYSGNSAASGVQIYLDGVAGKNTISDNLTQNISTPTTPLFAGQRPVTTDVPAAMRLDDLLIWPVVLTASDATYLAAHRGAIYQLLAGSSPINGQSLIRPADSKPYQQLIGV